MRVSWILALVFAGYASGLAGNQDGFDTKNFDAIVGGISKEINETIGQVQSAYQAIADGRLPPQFDDLVQRTCGPLGLSTACFQQKMDECFDTPLRCSLNQAGELWERLCPCGLSVKLVTSPKRILCCAKDLADYLCSQTEGGCIEQFEKNIKVS